MWVVFFLAILLYNFKLPLLGIPLYSVIYMPLAAWLLLLKYRRLGGRCLRSTSVVSTSTFCWLAISVWGSLLAVINGTIANSLPYIRYTICFACVVLVLSSCFLKKKQEMLGLGFVFFFSALVALSGIYEGVTGNYYHLTHLSYRYSRNMFGLYKPNTIFYNINDSAVFMNMMLILSYLFADKCTKRGGFVRMIALILFGGNILLTESRGALFGLIIFLYIFYIDKWSIKNRIMLFILLLPVVISGLAWLTSIIDTSDFNMESMGGRGAVWRKSIHTLGNSFLLGTGPGMTTELNAYADSFGASVAAIHSFFLEILCDYGLPGGGILIGWYCSLVAKLRKKVRLHKNFLIAFAGLIAFIPLSVTSSSLIGKTWVLCFFGVLICEIDCAEREQM